MLKKMLILLTAALPFFSLLVPGAHSDEIRLHIPIIEDSPRQHILVMIIVWSKCRGNPPVVALERTKIAQGKGNHGGIAPTDRFKR